MKPGRIRYRYGQVTRYFLILLFVFGFLFAGLDRVAAQTTGIPFSLQDKRPSPRDPTAKKSVIPPQYKKNLDSTSPALMIDPTGEATLERFQKAQEEKALEKKRMAGRLLEKDMEDIPSDRERVILEKNLLQQFGTEQYPREWQLPEPYENETPLRRFQITFFLSLPFSMGVSYGLFSAVKQAYGEPRALTGPQTAGMLLLGVALSTGVGLYDLDRWEETESRTEEDRESSLLIQREENLRKIAADRAASRPVQWNGAGYISDFSPGLSFGVGTRF